MEAKVIKIVDEYKIAINKGSLDGVNKSDKFIIFKKGEELFDPDTNESLGFLEIPKLKMKVFNIQEKMTLLESNETIIETDRKIKKTIKKYTDNKYPAHYSSFFRNLTSNENDETETIIEEEPKERTITIKERDIEEGNIARKI
ncbi:hypothetical protein ACN5PC_04045 [Aliarcobacter butzleri]|uniref:hypothetical protein n=1 Tax=Aliarcobacter butzleri TaxID=28197 RepID=UPI003AF9C2FC